MASKKNKQKKAQKKRQQRIASNNSFKATVTNDSYATVTPATESSSVHATICDSEMNLSENAEAKKSFNNAEALSDSKSGPVFKRTSGKEVEEDKEEEETQNEYMPLLDIAKRTKDCSEHLTKTDSTTRDMESVKSIRSLKSAKSHYEDVTNDFPGLIVNELLSGDKIIPGGDGSFLEDLESGATGQYGSTPEGADDELMKLKVPSKERTIVLSSMYMGTLLAALDVSIISTLLPHIASEFNALDKVTQIVSAYLLSSATVQPLYGKISDIYGRKSLLIICNLIFALGCFICGQHNNTFNSMVFGRILQGIGGSGMTSVASMATSDLVTLQERAFYQGIGNFFYAIGIASGGVIGGILNDKFDWRFSFMIQVPMSFLSLISIVIFMKLPSSSKKYTGMSNFDKLKAIDWAGSIFLMAFLFTFSYGGSWYMYTLSLIFLLILIKIETSLTSKEPILPIHFLKIRSIFGAAWSNFFCMATSVTCMFYLPMYWTTILGLSTTETGWRLAPNFFSTAFGSLGAGLYMKKTGRYYNFLMGFCIIGVLGCFRLMFITPNIVVWQQYLCLVVPGFAMAVMITVDLLIMIAAVPQEDQAACTSISYAFRSTGSTVGISLAGLIFSKKLHSELIHRVMKFTSDEHPKHVLKQIIANAEKSSDFIKTAPDWIKPVLITCFHYALKNVFIFTFVAFTIATLAASICKEYKLHAR
ncbi:hypothetical protein QEN19_002092 [Hanseniaspora menglaensis]